MPDVVEIIPHPDGGRTIIFDDGSRILELGTIHIEGDPGPRLEERGLGDRLALGRDPGAMGHREINPRDAADLEYLRFEIRQGNITRESRPIAFLPPEPSPILLEHNGWVYMIGQRTGTLTASPVTARLGDTPFVSRDRYLWGVRGSSAARAAWRRDFRRAGGSLLVSRDAEDVLADTGVPPAAATQPRYTGEFSLADIPRAMLMLSQAALDSQEDVRRYTDRFVARYDDESYGSLIGILAGILEFGYRLITDMVGLPAAIAELVEQLGTILQSIEESLPELAEGLQTAPGPTILIVINATIEAIGAISGLTAIGQDLGSSVEHAEEGREAQSSLNVIRATGRVIELILIVKALVTALRRIPSVVRRMRQSLTRLNQVLAEMQAARRALREADDVAGAIEDARPRDAGRSTPDARESRGAGDTEGARERAPDAEGRRRARDESATGGASAVEREIEQAEEILDELNVDGAFEPDSPYGPSQYGTDPEQVFTRVVRGRRAFEAERRAFQHLLDNVLTPAQRRALRRITAGRRLNVDLAAIWRSVMTGTDYRDLRRIRQLMQRAGSGAVSATEAHALRRQAYQIARRRLYPRVARKFWNAVRRDEDAARLFTDAGFTLRQNRVPVWILDDGREIRLSLEHTIRVSDDPLRCVDPSRLTIAPLAENSYLLEAIRAIRDFTRFASGQ